MFPKGGDDTSEIPAARRFREGLRSCANTAGGVYPESPELGGGGIVDRSVTSSRKPTQLNRDGGSGCYPRVRGETYGGSA